MSREMKDSGVDWIGEIPKHWEITKLKYVFSIKKDISNELGHEILSVTQSGLKIKDISTNEGQISADYSKYQLVDIGDFVMNHMDLLTGWVDCSKYQGVTSPDYRVFKLVKAENHCKEFYTYLFQICYMNKIFYGLGQGVSNLGRWRLQTDKFINFMLPKLPVTEQKAIAHYLDQKCTEIDSIIENTKASIEEYKTYKQLVITEAVTKGLNPNAPVKDSGFEWIGDIPEHWRITKIGKIFSFLGGYAFSSNDYSQPTNNQVIRIGNVKNDSFELDKNPIYINDEIAQKAQSFEIKTNDILFTMTGTKGKRDYFYTLIVNKDHLSNRLFLNQRVGCFRTLGNVNPSYYNYLLKNNKILESIFIYETGTANQGNLGSETIKRTQLHLPPVEEQQQIVEHLNIKCIEIDNLISQKQQIISELETYKKSLIFECVTGKKVV